MAHRRILLVTYLFVLCLPTLALSDGSGLDGYGCHHNRKAGGYHCHRGPLAGEHFASKAEMLRKLQQKQQSQPFQRK
jgi:hypothetical protein